MDGGAPLETAWRVAGQQAIGFMTHAGGQVAYAISGRGPALLLDASRAHDLDAFWRHTRYRQLVQKLAQTFTVVRWDRQGFGLSDRAVGDLSVDGELALLDRLAKWLGITEASVLAGHDAGPVMIELAARRPDLVSRLALFGTAVDGRGLAPWLPPVLRAVEAVSVADRRVVPGLLAAAVTGSGDVELRAWLAGALGDAADGATMTALLRSVAGLDAREAATRIAAPTLVLHREGDAAVGPDRARELAALIPGAKLAIVAGPGHLLFGGDLDPVLAALVPFLSGAGPSDHVVGTGSLSGREMQVARLVTLGLTNAEIALRLAIRRRTVEAHLDNVRTKLGVGTRARVAAWVVTNQLDEPIAR